jgi:hypothetical protein
VLFSIKLCTVMGVRLDDAPLPGRRAPAVAASGRIG